MTKKDKSAYKKSNRKQKHHKESKIQEQDVKLQQNTNNPLPPMSKPISKLKKTTEKNVIKKQTIQHVQNEVQNVEQNTEQKEEQGKDKKKSKSGRLIIRNLVFDINEKHIRKLMQPFGDIIEIIIPRHPDKNTSKGFAFVQFANKNMSLKAIKQLNQTTYKGRTIVLDLAVAKDKYLSEKLLDNKDQDADKDSNQNQKEPEIKEDPIQEQNNDQEEDDEDEDDNEEDEDANSVKEQKMEQQSEQKNEEDYGDEIFIRNLPMSVTEQQLLKTFKRYGKIVFAKLVINKQTNKSKGTAFIKFHDPEVAKKLIEYSRGYQMYMLKKNKFFKIDPAINLQIDGMIMKIFPVESRKSIQDKLKERTQLEKSGDTKKKVLKKIKKLEDLINTDTYDKRRLKLGLEGFWRADESTMNEQQYEKFKNHEKQKVQKLKNPNHSISPTRIILKFLDKSITQENLRTLASDFLQEKGLKFSELTFCKLMLDHNREKSAGFAFIEFRHHQVSQQFIEAIVANPQLVMKRKFLIEYAIQDSKALLKLKNKNKKQKPTDRDHRKQDKSKQMNKKPKKMGKKISKMNNRVKETHQKRKIQKK